MVAQVIALLDTSLWLYRYGTIIIQIRHTHTLDTNCSHTFTVQYAKAVTTPHFLLS